MLRRNTVVCLVSLAVRIVTGPIMTKQAIAILWVIVLSTLKALVEVAGTELVATSDEATTTDDEETEEIDVSSLHFKYLN